MNRAADSRRDVTPKQGLYLAFIHAYTLVNGRPPAEADMIRFFRVTPPDRSPDGAQPREGRADLTQARGPAQYRGPARTVRLARAKSERRSTSQNHCDEVLVPRIAKPRNMA